MRTIADERSEVRQQVVAALITVLRELTSAQTTARLQTGDKPNAANTIFTEKQMVLIEKLIGNAKALDADMDRSEPYGENDHKTLAGTRPLFVLQSGGGSIGHSSARDGGKSKPVVAQE